MASIKENNLELNYGWPYGESGWNSGMDENIVKLGFESRKRINGILSSPPSSPSNGDAYIVGTAPTGLFSGKFANIAIYDRSSWVFITPKSQEVVFNTSDGCDYIYNNGWSLKLEAEVSPYIKIKDFTFSTGYTITDQKQCLLNITDNHYYQWNGTLPKVVSAGATPATSGGIGAGSWVDRTDVTLRSDINIVVKRFASVADMVADMSLVVGQNVEWASYYSGLNKGGNCGIVVASGTGTPDGGSFISLSNGLQVKAFFNKIIDFCQFGAVADGVTDNKLFFQRAFDYAQNHNYSRGDRLFYTPMDFFLPPSAMGYASSGNVTVAEYAKIDLADNTIIPIGHPECMFKLNLRDYTNSDSTTDGYYYRSHVRGFEFKNVYAGPDRGFGVQTLQPDFNYFFLVDGGWLMNSGFYNIKSKPGAAFNALIHFDLSHHNPHSLESGVPDAIEVHNVTAQYSENCSTTISFYGDSAKVGTGSRCGSIDFKHINGGTSGINWNRVKNGSTDFGVIRVNNCILGQASFDWIYGQEHLIYIPDTADLDLSLIKDCEFKRLYAEKSSDSGTGRGPMLYNGKYQDCDFEHFEFYVNATALTRQIQVLDITAIRCKFNKLVFNDSGLASALRPSDTFKLRVGSIENRFTRRPQSKEVTYDNYARHAYMFTVPKADTIFDWLQTRTFTTLKDKDVTTSTDKTIISLSGNSLDVSTCFSGKFGFEQYGGSSSTWQVYASYTVGGVSTETVLLTLTLASGNESFVNFIACPGYKTPVWNDATNEWGFNFEVSNAGVVVNSATLVNPISFNGIFRIGVRCTAFTGTDINWHGSVCTATNCDVYVNEAS